MEKKLRILSLCGGGIRGILAARVLRFVEEYTQRPIWQLFDLVCGTSAGGILAAALTKPIPLSARDCEMLLLRHGATIFGRSSWRTFHTANATFAPKYDGVGLRDTLTATFGNAALESALVPTFVTAYGLESRQPALFRSWAPDGEPRRLVDVCAATSAAPTYFPPAQVGGHWYVDGGTVANNPSLCGVIEACKRSQAHTRDCLVLSLGTGLCEAPIDPLRAQGWGRLGWVAPLIDVMLDGVPDLTHVQMGDLLPDGQYLHIEPTLRASEAALDNTNVGNMALLVAIAEKAIDTQKEALVALLERLKGQT